MASGDKEAATGPKRMEDDYLWDGSGEPDREIQRLEVLLRGFQHSRPAPVFPEVGRGRGWRIFFRRVRLLPALPAIAVAVVMSAALAFLVRSPKPMPAAEVGWEVIRIAGTPQVGPKAIGVNEGTGKLSVGQLLETDSQSRANLRA